MHKVSRENDRAEEDDIINILMAGNYKPENITKANNFTFSKQRLMGISTFKKVKKRVKDKSLDKSITSNSTRRKRKNITANSN